MWGGEGGAWNVQNAVPLSALFFMDRAPEHGVEQLRPLEVSIFITASSEQLARAMSRQLSPDELRAERLQRFENACALARAVSCYRLHFSLEGPFWEEIEDTLDRQDGADGQHAPDTAATAD